MIALGCDHGGYQLMKEIISYFDQEGLKYKNFGTFTEESCDYTDYAQMVGHAVSNKKYDYGILICGTGIGISIAANKIPGIRAALCGDCFSAEATRLHNDANILVLGGRVIGPGLALKIVTTFLNTEFSREERHIRRIKKIEIAVD